MCSSDLRSSGTMRDDLGFHGTLPGRIRRRLAAGDLAHRRGKIVAALLLWQVVNAWGFAVESLANLGRCGGK